MSTKTKATISTKGHLIDPNCRHSDGKFVELADGSILNCTLNQTEIGSNKNKFYIMQVIKIAEWICCFHPLWENWRSRKN